MLQSSRHMTCFTHLENHPARYQPCPRCGHHTITAITSGYKLRADPCPLDTSQEIAALLTGRRTFDVLIWGLPKRMHLEWRSLTRIRAPRKHPVIATHQCVPTATRPRKEPETGLVIPQPVNDSAEPAF
jgi:hypothetical protein